MGQTGLRHPHRPCYWRDHRGKGRQTRCVLVVIEDLARSRRHFSDNLPNPIPGFLLTTKAALGETVPIALTLVEYCPSGLVFTTKQFLEAFTSLPANKVGPLHCLGLPNVPERNSLEELIVVMRYRLFLTVMKSYFACYILRRWYFYLGLDPYSVRHGLSSRIAVSWSLQLVLKFWLILWR